MPDILILANALDAMIVPKFALSVFQVSTMRVLVTGKLFINCTHRRYLELIP